MSLSPVAEVEAVLLVLPALEAAGGLDVLVLLGVEELPPPPHAASPTTAAAARPEAANHRLRIVSSPFATVTRSARTPEDTYAAPNAFKPGSDWRQADIRSHSQASESGYR
jgi:hypothetical protein